MTDLRTAAQQALGALESPIHEQPLGMRQEAIDALRATLAQQAEAVEPVATVTECEACFTPDVCQLRGRCDYYTASQMRIAAPPQQAEPRNQCRSDGRCQYAIDHGAEGIGHCPKGKCVMAQHTQPAEDRDVAQSNLRVMKEMFREQTEPAQQAEPVQEPVAVFDARWGQPVLLSGAPLLEDEQPLYTTPPRRKPLTDEDVNEVIAGCYGYSADFEFHQCLVRAIERAHGIGGQDER